VRVNIKVVDMFYVAKVSIPKDVLKIKVGSKSNFTKPTLLD